ncbi:MAG: YkgJ family cysteine cluster protein [Candidatus Methylomirabilia bacterium]
MEEHWSVIATMRSFRRRMWAKPRDGGSTGMFHDGMRSRAVVSHKKSKRGSIELPSPTLPVAQSTPPVIPCTECSLCCTYVAVGIEGPTTVKGATDILWFLYHEKVSVFRDIEGDWYVQFETRCRNRADDRRCGIYEQRPHRCREYDETSCEVNATDDGNYFYTPLEFLEHLQHRRKSIYRALVQRYVPSRMGLDARRQGQGWNDQGR